MEQWFQRPKRAPSISTINWEDMDVVEGLKFQRPKRAPSISTMKKILVFICLSVFQRPKRAPSISTEEFFI